MFLEEEREKQEEMSHLHLEQVAEEPFVIGKQKVQVRKLQYSVQILECHQTMVASKRCVVNGVAQV